ncbi:MAG: 50S ribosomal protein L22, partial [Candidatus Pacebacteria bacterium]|nr:50S ribosomal protein L22 [Candidatus Paceibacterota bacterium]
RQAIANAMNNHGLTFDDLTLKNIVVTGGPSYKRFRAVSRGRAHSIIKRTCHVSVELESGVVPKEAAPVKKAKNAAKVEKTETVEEKKVATKTAKKPVATKKVSKKK